MKFGKRRGREASQGDGAVEAPASPDAGTQEWPAAGGPADSSMAPPEPLTRLQPESEPAEPIDPGPEPVVEGEAVELPYEPPVPATPLDSVADDTAPAYETAPAYPHPIDPDPIVSVADSTSHHEPGMIPGEPDVRPNQGGAWPDPAFDLAERPEILVGAAFGGGILLALILRRLGN